jgi:hypothetical protein
MEIEGPLFCSQYPTTGHILNRINLLHTLPTHFFKINFNIILPFTPSFT